MNVTSTSDALDAEQRMKVRDGLRVLADTRDRDTIVVTHQGSSRVWPLITSHPLDFHYNPSTMGGAVPLGLGLALAQPRRKVIVITGDGSLLMSLGSLVTVAATGVRNLTVVVMDNGIYEVTGGQRTANAQAESDFAAIALAAGFQTARVFGTEATWRKDAQAVVSSPGPVFVTLRVLPADPDDMKTAADPMAQQVARFEAAAKNP